MSALVGDMVGAKHTGLIDPDVRPDAYTTCTDFMNEALGGEFSIPRKLAKEAFMTMFYGSKAVPKRVFGDRTPELLAFYQAANKTAPGAYYLLDKLLKAWQPFALSHDWTMADGFNVHVKVMKKVETRIEVDELCHSTFEYEYFVNEGDQKGLALGAK